MSKADGNKEEDVQNGEVTQPAAPEVAAPPAAAVPNVQPATPAPEMQVSNHQHSRAKIMDKLLCRTNARYSGLSLLYADSSSAG
jgi:hypothetical protein